MSKDFYALAQLVTSIATLLGVVFGFVSSLRNGQKIRDVHAQTNDMKRDLFTLTGRIYTPKRKEE